MARSRLWSWRVIRLHITLVVLCVSFVLLARWQIDRALSGNELSWAYAIEWPLFTVYAIVLWRRLLLDELHGDREKNTTRRLPLANSMLGYRERKRIKLERQNAKEDLERGRYNSYLAELQAKDNDTSPSH